MSLATFQKLGHASGIRRDNDLALFDAKLSEIGGQIVDARTGRGVSDALVIALKPGVRVMDFVRRQRPDMSAGN